MNVNVNVNVDVDVDVPVSCLRMLVSEVCEQARGRSWCGSTTNTNSPALPAEFWWLHGQFSAIALAGFCVVVVESVGVRLSHSHVA